MPNEEVDLVEGIAGMLDFLNAEATGGIRGETIGRYEENNIIIDTCWTNDCQWYETAVKDPRYHDSFIIVGQYGRDRAAAEVGHNKYVIALTAAQPPPELTNIRQFGLPERSFPLKPQ